MTEKMMAQQAPWPAILEELVPRVRQIDGRQWSFRLGNVDRGQGSTGLTLVITITGPNTYRPEQTVSVNHYMLVPPAAFDARSWVNWLFEQIMLVLRHEAMEGFQIDGKPVYPPAHGPGNDPYLRLDYGTSTDRRTSFRGELNPE
jgi:hypothetical protein